MAVHPVSGEDDEQSGAVLGLRFPSTRHPGPPWLRHSPAAAMTSTRAWTR